MTTLRLSGTAEESSFRRFSFLDWGSADVLKGYLLWSSSDTLRLGVSALSFPDMVRGATGSHGRICIEAMLGGRAAANRNRGGETVRAMATGVGIRLCPKVVHRTLGVGRSADKTSRPKLDVVAAALDMASLTTVQAYWAPFCNSPHVGLLRRTFLLVGCVLWRMGVSSRCHRVLP